MQINGTLILHYFKELTNRVWYHPPSFEIKLNFNLPNHDEILSVTRVKFRIH